MAQEELAHRALTQDKEDRDDIMNLATSEVAEASLAQIDVNDLVADLTGWRETLADLLEQRPRVAFERLY